MTRGSNYSGATPFSGWLRSEPVLDSHYGFNTTDIDYIWSDRIGGDGANFMFLEEKCRGTTVTESQARLFRKLHDLIKDVPLYRGFHVIVFEAETPVDGGIKLDGTNVTTAELITFLEFESPREVYRRCVL